MAAIPFTADQKFWGKRVFRLGIGPEPIPRHRLTVDNLTQLIRALTGNESMRERAVQVGLRLKAEDGVVNAVRIIENYLKEPIEPV